MPIATAALLEEIDTLARKRAEEIRTLPDTARGTGTCYYVAANGDDTADGRTPQNAWRTLSRASAAALCPGDTVLFRRGDLFRGKLICHTGVTYAAFGEGEKPRFYSHERDLADPALWELYDEAANIWRLRTPILDVGMLWFDGAREHGYKHIPSYTREGRFVCRDRTERPFVITRELTHDLDFYWHFDAIMTTRPSCGEDFPIPEVGDRSLGILYLRSNRGNPGNVFSTLEAAVRKTALCVGESDYVTVENLSLFYYGWHGIAAAGSRIRGLHVRGCEIGYIGGVIHSYLGVDPNYPEGGRGTIGRLGNAVEIYGGCDDYLVEDCHVHDVYDAGLTHQVTTNGRFIEMTNVTYRKNLIERCVYGIEYFLQMNEGDTESYMENILMEENLIRHSGEGFGQQRHNTHTPAHIKGWSFENAARNYTVRNNILDRAGRRTVHLVALCTASCPKMEGNTYIQYAGGALGKYGGREAGEPSDLYFDGAIEESIRNLLGDKTAKVYTVKK